ncbi:RNA-directed DNA polymerase, eukaryota, reverse transcriptase zinc-binding domain protein, partial [Tanacetum coccineum]
MVAAIAASIAASNMRFKYCKGIVGRLIRICDEFVKDVVVPGAILIYDVLNSINYWKGKMIHLAWHIVGTDVCKAVKEFFAKGKLLGELNATLITLVPKISTPKKVSDFRPIACCNITDNLLLSQELLKGYDCKKGPKRCSMKIDIQKAYDTVDWGFLEDTLRLFWISSQNGNMDYGFYGSFNLILQQKIKEDGCFKYHFGCKRLKITHLSFADDLLVLCNGDANSVKVIKKALDSFSKVSGLHPNLGKSIIFCGNMDKGDIERILHILPFKQGKLPMRYLGVPLVAKKIGVKDCKCLLDKIKDRISCWKNNSLSYAGRTQLLASVLASIQVYWASVFRFPKMVIKDMERLFKGFLWNKGELQRGKARVSWKEVCQPKQNGGLGLKPIESWNPSCETPMECCCQKRYSLGAVDLHGKAERKECLGVRNGCNISTWHDKWCHLPALDSIVSRREIFAAGFSNEDTIAGCILHNKWKWPEEWYSKYPILNQYIVPTLNNNISDKLMWIGNNGCEKEYAINHVWKDLRILNAYVQWWKVIWFTQNVPRHAFVLWMAIKGKLVTQDKLNVWYPGKNLKCPLCLKIEDSHKHLFFECDYSKSVWREMQSLANIQQLNDLESSMNSLASLPCKNNIWSVVRRLCVADTVYHLWQERNLRTFQDKNRSYKCLITVIKDNIKSRLIVGKNMVLRPAEFVTSQRNRSDTEIKGVFGYSRWPCILNLSLSELMFWNSINWSGLGRRLAGLLLGGCMFPGNDAWSSLLDLLYSEDVADVHKPKLMARKCSYSEKLIVSEGFDEYLNLVLDQAEEVSIKKKTRKPL